MTPTNDPAYARILEAVAASDDAPTSLRVTTWILDEMASTFYVLAFADACDECAEAGTPHPFDPGAGGSYDACAEAAPEPAGLRAECARRAVVLYAAVLDAPGGYDPAPAVRRWVGAGNNVPSRWNRWENGHYTTRDLEAAARCWGHYAAMSAVRHGVSWEDDNAPLTGAVAYTLRQDGVREPHVSDLPAVGDLGVRAEAPTWDDEHTERADIRMQEAERRAEYDEENR